MEVDQRVRRRSSVEIESLLLSIPYIIDRQRAGALSCSVGCQTRGFNGFRRECASLLDYTYEMQGKRVRTRLIVNRFPWWIVRPREQWIADNAAGLLRLLRNYTLLINFSKDFNCRRPTRGKRDSRFTHRSNIRGRVHAIRNENNGGGMSLLPEHFLPLQRCLGESSNIKRAIF